MASPLVVILPNSFGSLSGECSESHSDVFDTRVSSGPTFDGSRGGVSCDGRSEGDRIDDLDNEELLLFGVERRGESGVFGRDSKACLYGKCDETITEGSDDGAR